MIAHIAPPNWYTFCDKSPDEVLTAGETAYDLCSLDEHLDDPTKWCQECVRQLYQQTDEYFGSDAAENLTFLRKLAD